MMKAYPETASERFEKANLWIKYTIFKIRKYLKDDILEVGAGWGSFTKSYMNNLNSITLTDMDDDNFNILNRNFVNEKKIKVLKSLTKDINQKFNSIIYLNVLEHIEEDKLEIETALEKLNNVGYLVILVPAHQKMYSKLDKAVGHFKRYDIDFFKTNHFKNSKIVKLQFLDTLGYTLYQLNKIFFKNEIYPSNFKIFVWDKIFTPFTIIIDYFTRYKFGKNILCVYQKIDQ